MEPWYKSVKPRSEVREGRSFNPGEFAIHLEQVVSGAAPDDKASFEIDVNDVIRDAPRTRAAAVRIKAFLGKVPGTVGSALRDIAVDLASEAAKKIILAP